MRLLCFFLCCTDVCHRERARLCSWLVERAVLRRILPLCTLSPPHSSSLLLRPPSTLIRLPPAISLFLFGFLACYLSLPSPPRPLPILTSPTHSLPSTIDPHHPFHISSPPPDATPKHTLSLTQQVLQQHFPGRELIRDIAAVHDLPPEAELLAASFPCPVRTSHHVVDPVCVCTGTMCASCHDLPPSGTELLAAGFPCPVRHPIAV